MPARKEKKSKVTRTLSVFGIANVQDVKLFDVITSSLAVCQIISYFLIGESCSGLKRQAVNNRIIAHTNVSISASIVKCIKSFFVDFIEMRLHFKYHAFGLVTSGQENCRYCQRDI
jgi:hypothetical protein